MSPEVKGNLGTVGHYDVRYEGGAGIVELSAEAGPIKLSFKAELAAKSLAIAGLKAVKDLIPGTLDDMLIDAAVAELEKLA